MKRLAILTSGGDAPGMNATIRAVYNKATKHSIEVIGVQYGFLGLMCKDFIDLKNENLESVIATGGTILHSARLPEFENKELQLQAIENLREEKIDGLIVIGGNGSYQGALALSELGFPTIGIPGTIDNDIPGTEFTIGFDTSINTVLNALDKIRDTATSHVKTFIIEVMGRKAGDIALWSGVAGGAEYILVPEKEANIENLAKKIQQGADRGKKHCLIVLAEGVMSASELAKKLDEYGTFHTRQVELGHVARGGSPTTFDRVLAAKSGSYAVDLFMNNFTGVCISVQNNKLISLDIRTALFDSDTYTDISLFNLNNSISF